MGDAVAVEIDLAAVSGCYETVVELQRQDAPVRRRLVRFDVPLPVLVEDVRPCVSDVMTSKVVTADSNESVYQIGRRMRGRRIRAIPLVDGDGYLQGLITVEDFSRLLFEEMDPAVLDKINSVLNKNISRSLLVANLPYNIASPLIINLVTGKLTIDAMYVTVQNEVADRMTAGRPHNRQPPPRT